MSDYDQMWAQKNLERAYRWLLSNPDARYKSLFRDSYAAFAISPKRNLTRIRDELRHHRYEATHASKVFLPKPSGILRPITLLNVDDQIVYQACVNVIADKLKPLTKQRYRKRVFNHLYAGKTSKFFYYKWQPSYRAFSNSVCEAFKNGYVWVANFDLASFYDTIDHQVLRHFLLEIGVDEELTKFLIDNLRVWTSSSWSNRSNAIYHGHGIPQGPLSSGMLSEVVLKHIDETGERGGAKRVKYYRYVDDIKIFAKKESHLRRKLIALDLSAKEIGLFPQSSKINIRQLVDPKEEIKSVSNPPEPSIGPFGGQVLLVKRLLELTKGGRIEKEGTTRFKYLLGHVFPTYRLNERLLSVVVNHPELSESIAKYFIQFPKLPRNSAKIICRLIEGEEHYHSVHGDLLRAVLYNAQEPEKSQLANFCYRRLFARPKTTSQRREPQPTYKEALISWVITTKKVSFTELESLRDNEVDWWVRKSMLRELSKNHFGLPSFESFLNSCIYLNESEIARCAAAQIVTQGVSVKRPYGKANIVAKDCLKSAGIIRAVGRPKSFVATVLQYVIGLPIGHYDWQKILGKNTHKDAEQLAVTIK